VLVEDEDVIFQATDDEAHVELADHFDLFEVALDT
jgi:hypothetical protein